MIIKALLLLVILGCIFAVSYCFYIFVIRGITPAEQAKRRKQLNLAKRVGDINGNKIIDIEDSSGQTPTLYLVYDDRNQYRVANKVIIDILNEYPHLITKHVQKQLLEKYKED